MSATTSVCRLPVIWACAILLGTLGGAGAATAQAPATSPGSAASRHGHVPKADSLPADGPRACYRRALEYKSRKDYPRYFKWLRKAALKGSVRAEDILGFDYALGQGLPQDYGKSMTWYRRAAAQGDPDAQCELGLDYALGLGVKKNRMRAVKLYRQAAAEGYQPARTLLPY
ncbi:MAG: tetratricopeptide repeat protein [Gammaproteobacteria bacterium]